MEPRQAYLWFALPGLVFVDLVAKFWARTTLVPGGFSVDLGPFLGLQFTENPGATLGLLSFGDGSARLVLLAMTIALAIGLGVWLVRTRSEWRRLFVGLIFAGAVGNIADRFVNGGVTDFIVYRWFGAPLFVGNVADLWITIGAIGAFGGLLISGPAQSRQPVGTAGGD